MAVNTCTEDMPNAGTNVNDLMLPTCMSFTEIHDSKFLTLWQHN